MKIKDVAEIPKKQISARREVVNILEEFLQSGKDLVEVEFNKNEDARHLSRNLYQLCYQYNYPIKVKKRQEHIYLERMSEEDVAKQRKTIRDSNTKLI